jgi:hypothetical protein
MRIRNIGLFRAVLLALAFFVSASAFAQISVKQSPYNAIGNGRADDTAAINAAASAARAATVRLNIPSGTYLVSATLDLTGIEVFGSGRQNTIIQASASVEASSGFDVIQTKGYAHITNLTIQGGWASPSTNVKGNAIATLSAPGANPAYYGYQNTFENLNIQNVNGSCIYINDGAYETIRNIRCNAFGVAGIYLDSDNYPNFVTTSTVVDGESTFSDVHPGSSLGYGVYIKDGITITVRNTTIDNTKGIYVDGCNNRQIEFDGVEQSLNSGAFLVSGGCGIGLSVINSFARGTTGIAASTLTNWQQLYFYNDDFSVPASRQ